MCGSTTSSPRPVWRRRYELIRDFEQSLSAEGTRIVKFYLHISKEEQADRFRRRLERPDKRWKFSHGDLEERKHWDDYRAAFNDALARDDHSSSRRGTSSLATTSGTATGACSPRSWRHSRT